MPNEWVHLQLPGADLNPPRPFLNPRNMQAAGFLLLLTITERSPGGKQESEEIL